MSAHTKLILYPYNLGSKSSRLLAEKLSCKRVRANGTYRHFNSHLVVNWGNSQTPNWGTPQAMGHMLNKPQNVANASEKIRTFQILQAVIPNAIPPWTTSKATALGWLETPIYGSNKNAVVCRTLTRANSGRGITLAGTVGELVNAPLYTRYKPKVAEYRIHITARFGIVDSVQKKRRNGAEDASGIEKYIRSHDNGWVFCREGILVPDPVRVASEEALAALGLDFGAVDVGYHPDYGVSIYEINTAPGIEGQTLVNYADVFRRYLSS